MVSSLHHDHDKNPVTININNKNRHDPDVGHDMQLSFQFQDYAHPSIRKAHFVSEVSEAV